MTQFEFDVICRVVENGAPALAKELIEGLTGVINTANEAIRERDELKKQLEKLTSDTDTPAEKKASK